MKRLSLILCAASIAAVAGIAAPASRADVDVSFGARAPVGDGNLFFSISSRYFDRDPRIVNDWGRRFRNPDDLAVFFYIVQHSRMSPEQVYALRMRRMPWFEVGRQAGMRFNEWYVTYNGVPGGRYARPYRYYDRYRSDPRFSARLSDKEIRDLVAVRMAHEYYGVSPQTAMDWRRNGSNVQVIMTREYRNRHRHDRDRNDDRDHDRYDGRRDDYNRNDR
jgi:hypothetical protein